MSALIKKTSAALALMLICLAAGAKLNVKQPYSDGMVLQQNASAAVKGFASPGSQISVTTGWNGRSYRTRTGSDGIWTVKVATPAASYRSYQVKVSGDGGSMTIDDVLIGEVWLAGGQSNMEMPVSGFDSCPIDNYLEIITQAPAREKIRMFTVPIVESMTPLDACEGKWYGADPATIPSMSATAYFFALKLNTVLDVPIGIVACPRGGSSVESWLPAEVLSGYPDIDISEAGIAATTPWTRPLVYFNGMFNPLAGLTAKGIIFYQGCTNVGREDTYAARLTRMVEIWRSMLDDPGSGLPFYEVEIAPYRYTGGQAGHAAMLRKAQHDAVGMIPRSGIVITNDLVRDFEIDNIHPGDKQPVGNRLAYLALTKDYGFNIPCICPEPIRAFRVEGSQAIYVKATDCRRGISRNHGVKGLEIAGPDGKFFEVGDVWYDNAQEALRISSPEVPNPVAVRYGWGDFVPGNLANRYGLPFSPFNLTVEQ